MKRPRAGPVAWIEARVRLEIANFLRATREFLRREPRETKLMLGVLYRLSRGRPVSKAELRGARNQLLDMAKMVPVLVIFWFPGGLILLTVLARVLPFDLLPRENFAEPGEETPP